MKYRYKPVAKLHLYLAQERTHRANLWPTCLAPRSSKLTTLTQLSINEDAIQSTLPAFISTLTQLRVLTFESDPVSGKLPKVCCCDNRGW